MTATLANYFNEFELDKISPAAPPRKNKTAKRARSPETDIVLWLLSNAPRNFQELQAARYTLYHRCSRDELKVSQRQDDNVFMLSGRQSSVLIVSNKARRYLLWKLRILARKKGWVGRKRCKLVAIG